MSSYNLTMLTDFYQLTMIQGYKSLNMDETVVFDLYYRKNPSGNGFAIVAGLEQVIDYIQNLKFTAQDIDYLRSLGCFGQEFLEYLQEFSFTGDLYAIIEGSVVFPNEPLIRVKAPITQAQFIETALLNIVNHQSLIATKASRVVTAAGGDGVLEFGCRRAQGPDAGVYGARAAMIGGCEATSNVLAGRLFSLPLRGTHAHSWIMSFDDEYSAFVAYAAMYPKSCTLLVDTYDTLKSGVPNAIKVFSAMKEKGQLPERYGIRLDSGDLAYLSKIARDMLDAAGLEDAKISASSDLDEYLIRDMKLQGTKISVWGVGTNLITCKDSPAFGGVYKLVAKVDKAGVSYPKIKLSENPDKVTNPGFKKVIRLYEKTTGKIKGDLIMLDEEKIDTEKDLTIFDPHAIWKKMTLNAKKFTTRDMLTPIFIGGELVYKPPTVMDIREYSRREINSLWDEYKRLVNPQILPVDLSLKLWNLKQNMISDIRGE